MGQRLLVAVRVILAGSLAFLNAPSVSAQQFGVVDDLYVGGDSVTPFGGLGRYQNLLIRSEELDNGAAGSGTWNRSTSTSITATNIAAPDGTTTAEEITFGSTGLDSIKQIAGTAAGSTQFTGSVWLKAVSGTPTVRIALLDEAATPASTYANAALDTTWQRFEVTKTFSSATGNAVFLIEDNTNTSTTFAIYAWGAQLESGVGTAGVYAKTVASAISTASRGLVSNTDLLVAGTQVTSSGLVDATKLTGVVPVVNGGTGLSSTTANQLLYSSSNSVIAGLATGNSGVLVTGGTGVPSIATDIPTAVTIGAKYVYRADGTDVPVADGGTGASTAADARTNLGLAAGGAGDIWVEKAGDTMTGTLTFSNVATELTTAGDENLTLDAAGTGKTIIADTLQLNSNAIADSGATTRLTLATSSPHVALTGDADVSGHAAVGANASVSTTNVLVLNESKTDPSGIVDLLDIDASVNLTANSTATVEGVNSFASVAAGTANSLTSIQGGHFIVNNRGDSSVTTVYGSNSQAFVGAVIGAPAGAGTATTLVGTQSQAMNNATTTGTVITNLYGVGIDARNRGPGTVSNLRGVNVVVAQADGGSGAGTITDLRGVNIDTSALSAGTVTTSTGLYINNMGLSGGTNAYGLYLAPQSGSGSNYGICFDCDGTWSSSTVAAGLQFGSDANAVTLYRSAANTLATDDTLQLLGHVVSPYGGLGQFQNLLVRSEEFNDAAWVKSASTTSTTDTIAAPDGTTTAEAITFGTTGLDTIKQDSSVTAASTQFTGSAWLKVASGTLTVRIGVIDEAGTPAGTYASALLTTNWQRFQVAHTFAAGATGTANFIIDDNTNSASQTIHAWGAQLESGVGTARVYAKTSAARMYYPRLGVAPAHAFKTGDVNRDGYVNFLDLNFVTDRFGCTLGAACWETVYEVDNMGNPLTGKDADLVEDGLVDGSDTSIVSSNLRQWSGVTLNGTTTLAAVNLQQASVVTLTADLQVVTVTNISYLRLSSDNATASNRDFCLSDGSRSGQILVLEWTHATNLGLLADGSEACAGANDTPQLSATWPPATPLNDTLVLIYNGTDWIELTRAAN